MLHIPGISLSNYALANPFRLLLATFVSFLALKLLPRCKPDKLPQHALPLLLLHAAYCCKPCNFATNKISANANIRKSHSLYLHTRTGKHTHTQRQRRELHTNCDQNAEMKSETTINDCSCCHLPACPMPHATTQSGRDRLTVLSASYVRIVFHWRRRLLPASLTAELRFKFQ